MSVDDVILFANYQDSIWKEAVSDLWKVTVIGDTSAEQNKCNKHCFVD